MGIKFDATQLTKISFNGTPLTKVTFNGTEVWPVEKYILNTTDESSYYWNCEGTPASGTNLNWGTGDPSPVLIPYVEFDVTNYSKCTVRVRGNVTNTPSGQVTSHTYILVGFEDSRDICMTSPCNGLIVDRWETVENEVSIGSGQIGKIDPNNQAIGYTEFGEVTLDISQLTGIQTLKMICGGAFQNKGLLYITKIHLHN